MQRGTLELPVYLGAMSGPAGWSADEVRSLKRAAALSRLTEGSWVIGAGVFAGLRTCAWGRDASHRAGAERGGLRLGKGLQFAP